MKRVPIRNLDSPLEVKPRVFDIVVVENQEPYFEVKQSGKRYERVKLRDVIKQLEEAGKNPGKTIQSSTDNNSS